MIPKDVFSAFGLNKIRQAEPFGGGHINQTFRVEDGTGARFIFQRLNTAIFREPEHLMENILRVTTHLAARDVPTLHFLRTSTGASVARCDDAVWRAYRFVENAHTSDIFTSEEEAFRAAQAFGTFQRGLADMPGERLHETILDFHNTPKRLDALEIAAQEDRAGRLRDVARELDFIRERADEAGTLVRLLRDGAIPERVCHNDTKLNNVLLSDADGSAVCVIDLDTVMPGLAHYDFGDMVRTGCSPAAEDERNLGLVGLRPAYFRALLQGYLAGAGNVFTRLEKELFPLAGKIITLETGTRFLADHLNGDVYFRIRRPGHNLDRCRTQLALVRSIENNVGTLQQIAEELS